MTDQQAERLLKALQELGFDGEREDQMSGRVGVGEALVFEAGRIAASLEGIALALGEIADSGGKRKPSV